ncbi:unnamed protein product [Litomosoides sigmodontis]|uniref:Probable RNA polymerase II nuclear localization protein SLC7A6OS n=1 Tax=Litomosoides sigmodontis TaxID=42156 RepID=A0A3P6UIC3_LITSI|nr:unnamed protein product [Litomosoides sigmodontis]
MFANHLASPSSSSPLFCPTVFRVRRKRTADPHSALIISLKRAKHTPSVTEPIICFRTSDLKLGFSSAIHSQHFNIIDVDPHQDTVNAKTPSANTDGTTEDKSNNSDVLSSNPLELMKDYVEEPSSNIKVIGETTIKSSQITLNGEPLVSLSNQDDEDFIFDYYWSSKTDGCMAYQIRDVRLANTGNLLYDGEDTESSAEDDEDSNDENNWRNDYPDESEHTSGCGSNEDTTSDGSDDYEDLEKHIGEMGFYDEDDSEGSISFFLLCFVLQKWKMSPGLMFHKKHSQGSAIYTIVYCFFPNFSINLTLCFRENFVQIHTSSYPLSDTIAKHSIAFN